MKVSDGGMNDVRGLRLLGLIVLLMGLGWPLAGCVTSGGSKRTSSHSFRDSGQPIRRVVCLYEDNPWLSCDRGGDRNPEGIQYCIFLDPGTGDGKGVLREGTFHIEMYLIDRHADGTITRKLDSDWHYPTSSFTHHLEPGPTGYGYMAKLRWASKATAGQEIELVTTYEDPEGRQIRSQTKRFRVPKYPN
jgi:hypothetical protein